MFLFIFLLTLILYYLIIAFDFWVRFLLSQKSELNTGKFVSFINKLLKVLRSYYWDVLYFQITFIFFNNISGLKINPFKYVDFYPNSFEMVTMKTNWAKPKSGIQS